MSISIKFQPLIRSANQALGSNNTTALRDCCADLITAQDKSLIKPLFFYLNKLAEDAGSVSFVCNVLKAVRDAWPDSAHALQAESRRRELAIQGRLDIEEGTRIFQDALADCDALPPAKKYRQAYLILRDMLSMAAAVSPVDASVPLRRVLAATMIGGKYQFRGLRKRGMEQLTTTLDTQSPIDCIRTCQLLLRDMTPQSDPVQSAEWPVPFLVAKMVAATERVDPRLKQATLAGVFQHLPPENPQLEQVRSQLDILSKNRLDIRRNPFAPPV